MQARTVQQEIHTRLHENTLDRRDVLLALKRVASNVHRISGDGHTEELQGMLKAKATGCAGSIYVSVVSMILVGGVPVSHSALLQGIALLNSDAQGNRGEVGPPPQATDYPCK